MPQFEITFLTDFDIEKFGIRLGDLLNTRSFLDHNRIYQKPTKTELSTKSEGAFAYRGKRIPNNELFQNTKKSLEILGSLP